MSTTVEFSVDSEEFILGKAENAGQSDLTVEVIELIPLDDGEIPYFWVIGHHREAFDAVLNNDPALSEFSIVEETDNRALYNVKWNHSEDNFVQMMVRSEGMLHDARGDAESWTFRLRFPNVEALSTFARACREANIEYTVDRLHTTSETQEKEDWELTDAQRSLIELAYREGYFDIPRGITLEALADKLEISDQSVNERLRRGLHSLVEATLDPDTATLD